MDMDPLFPSLEPYRSGLLPVGDVHTIYWEECGNPAGYPILFLHGGPGAPSGPQHRRFFDPGYYRILLFHQRGAGLSRPHAEMAENTPAHLVADIEALRRMWGVERWHVFGGSWGSTLALLYAETHPDRVSGLILRGIFTLRWREIDWMMTGLAALAPESHAAFLSFLPENERDTPLESYTQRLMNPDPAVHLPAAEVWARYEDAVSTLLPLPPGVGVLAAPSIALSLARTEAHYFRNNRFSPDDRILRDVPRIRHIPGVIVQGRYDLVCPLATAAALHQAWPEAAYIVVPDGGHAASEPGIARELVAATERFKSLSPVAP